MESAHKKRDNEQERKWYQKALRGNRGDEGKNPRRLKMPAKVEEKGSSGLGQKKRPGSTEKIAEGRQKESGKQIEQKKGERKLYQEATSRQSAG